MNASKLVGLETRMPSARAVEVVIIIMYVCAEESVATTIWVQFDVRGAKEPRFEARDVSSRWSELGRTVVQV